MNIIFERLRYC